MGQANNKQMDAMGNSRTKSVNDRARLKIRKEIDIDIENVEREKSVDDLIQTCEGASNIRKHSAQNVVQKARG